MNISLEGTLVSEDGYVIKQFCKDNDLILDNFGKLLAKHFWVTASPTVILKDVSATDRTLRVLRDVVNVDIFNNLSGSPNLGAFVRFGTSTATVQRSDTNIFTQIGSDANVSPAIYGNSKITFAASIGADFGQSFSVAEVGLFCNWQDTTSTTFKFILFHDAITPVPLVGGQTLSIRYLVNLI